MSNLLFFRNCRNDFELTPSSTQYSIEKLLENGHYVTVYDPRQRKIMDFNRREISKIITIPKFLNIPAIYIPLNFIALIIVAIKLRNKYDVSSFMYCRLEYMILSPLLFKIAKLNYIMIFGNIHRRMISLIRCFPYLYSKSDKIIIPSEEHKDNFVKFMENNLKIEFNHKTEYVEFPKINLEILKQITKEDISSIEKKYDIDNNDIVIMIGSNAARYEQHLKIIHELSIVREFPKKRVSLIFPLTYSADSDVNVYKKKVIDLAKVSLKQYKLIFIKEFLPSEEILALRKRSNIFVNMRASDQFAASVKESLIIGSIIVSGSWLPYSKFVKKHKLYIYEIDDPNELHEALTEIIRDFNRYKTISLSNSEKMTNVFSNEILTQNVCRIFQ